MDVFSDIHRLLNDKTLKRVSFTLNLSAIVLMLLTTGCKISINVPNSKDMITPFEKNNNVTATYQEAINYYTELGKKYSMIQVDTFGMTDVGRPLHEVIIDKDQDFDPVISKEKGKAVLFINNGIHPGEPCGIDATMMLARDLVKAETKLLDHVTIVIIPVYNIGGSLNRTATSRANQVGPEAYGFRGNAKNLDLNRDFVKCDSKNALSFNQLFTKWRPHVFIDNHTSNGADYQYVMTLIATQKDKLEPALSKVMTRNLLPYLYDQMENKGYEMTPYVDVKGTPDSGIYDFADYGRYSTGYAAMHNTIGFMPETHMLKPYKDRVQSTYLFMETMLEFINNNYESLVKAKLEAIAQVKHKRSFELNWKLDYNDVDSLIFKGYVAKYKPSEVSGISRLYYDQHEPYTKKIPYYNSFRASKTVDKPDTYIIPQAYSEVIERLTANGVALRQIEQDTSLKVEVYRITDYKTVEKPYESHYLHYGVQVRKAVEEMSYYKGDYMVDVDQEENRYIVETLEPEGPDSWFAWNFFDGILMQKEYFSSYVFEDLAADILDKDPELKADLEAKKRNDSAFAEDARAQLDFIYKRSPYYEPTHMRYPIGRIVK